MQTSDPAFSPSIERKAELYGLVLVPCDLTRAATSVMPSGAPILFVPRRMGSAEKARLVNEQIRLIKEKRGAA